MMEIEEVLISDTGAIQINTSTVVPKLEVNLDGGSIAMDSSAVKFQKKRKMPENSRAPDRSKYKRTHTLKSDMVKKHGERCFFECHECSSKYTRKHNLLLHMLNKHGERQFFECSECGLRYDSKCSLKRHTLNKHKDRQFFECSECGLKSDRKCHLKRHILKEHTERPSFECSECSLKYDSKCSLKRHMLNKHKDRQFFECSECGLKYDRKYHLKKHIFTEHTERPFFECNECGSRYKKKYHLNEHVVKKHGKRQFFECSECDFRSIYKLNLRRHSLSKHNEQRLIVNDKKSFHCYFCGCSYQKRTRVIDHYGEDHGINIFEDRLSFSNKEEFLEWKEEIETATNCSFRKYNKKYICHRSGLYTPKCKPIRQRRRGTKKVNVVCPAEIRFSQKNPDSRCTVSFLSTHVGHDPTTQNEYTYLPVPKRIKMDVAAKMSICVDNTRILHDTIDDALLYNLKNDVSREVLLFAQDIKDNGAEYNVNASENYQQPFQDDHSNVEMFVRKYYEFILYYKRQNEIDERFPMLKKDDIALIFMCTTQEELLKKFGNQVIAIDGTHGVNSYGFILHTILVLDYDYEGIPVVFAISNRDDITMMDIVLSCVKDRVGELHPQTLMTDMQEMYFNSWKKIMSIPKFHLFSTWHVREAWRRNLAKISSKEKRTMMKNLLYELSSETNVFEFHKRLDELHDNKDPDLTNFLNYFLENYSNNVDSWAYCKRLNAGVDTNMHVEAFHIVLKYLYGKKKNMKDLYSGLDVILNFLRWKLKNIHSKQIKGKYTNKLRQLRNAHDCYEKYNAENEGAALVQEDRDNGVWLVPSFGDSNNVYCVKKIRQICPVIQDMNTSSTTCNLLCTECKICAHLFTCTCTENSIKNIMCKHIHAVCSSSTDVPTICFNEPAIKVEILESPSDTNTSTNVQFKCIDRIRDYLEKFEVNLINEEQWKAVEHIIQSIPPTIDSSGSKTNGNQSEKIVAHR